MEITVLVHMMIYIFNPEKMIKNDVLSMLFFIDNFNEIDSPSNRLSIYDTRAVSLQQQRESPFPHTYFVILV